MRRTRIKTATQTFILAASVTAGAIAGLTASDEEAARDEALLSRITRVTVHLDHALVTREASVEMSPGEHRTVLKPLPAGLDPASVRVRASGAPGLTIRAVELRRLHDDPVPDAESAEVQEAIDDLSRQHTLVLERKKSLGVLREFVSGLKAAAV